MSARRRQAARRSWPPNLYQNRAGNYWFRNPENGKTFGLGADFKVAAAQARAANAELERRKGAVGLLHRIDGAETSFYDWCLTYEGAHRQGKANTLSAQKSQMNAVKLAPFAQQAVSKISPKEIADFVKTSAEERGTHSAGKIRSRLFDIFRDAIQNGLVDPGRNPVEVVLKPKKIISRDRLTLNDFNLILAETMKRPVDRWMANALLLALVCGQRREDLAKLQFDQVKDGFLWIEQSKGQEGKRAKLRIPLDLRLNAIGMSLDEVIKRCRDNVVSKSVIHLVRKTGNVLPGTAPKMNTLSIKFAKFRDDAGVTGSSGRTPPSFHEIRSLAARLYTEEYGAEFAQALLGHKSLTMTALYRDVRGREWTEIKLKAG